MTRQNRGTGLLGPGLLSTVAPDLPTFHAKSGDHFLEADLTGVISHKLVSGDFGL